MKIERRKLLQLGAVGAASLATGVFVSGCEPAAKVEEDADILDIAIIGAGMSGLAAGWELMKGGFTSFAVLEARNRVGGRVFNQTVNGEPVASGATWIGPGQTAIYDLCRQLEIEAYPSYWTGDTQIVMGDTVMRVPEDQFGAPFEDPALLTKLEALAKTVPLSEPWKAPNAAKLDAMTFGDWLKQNGMSDEEYALRNPTAALTFGARADQISLLYVLHYIHSAGSYTLLETMEGGAQQDRIKGGSQAVSLALHEKLGDMVRLDHPVTSVKNWDGTGPVEIETAKGTIKARRVILALSPSQAGEITFSPALPDGRQAIIDGWPRGGSGLTMHLGYKTPFWREAGLSGLILDVGPGTTYLFADLSPEDASSGIVKLLGLGMSTSPDKVKEFALATLVKCLGPEAAAPTEVVMQDWSQEQYTRGCVSPLTPGFLSKLTTPLAEPCGALHWAGTETALIWWGYQDGAVRAGQRAGVEALGSLVKL